MKRVVLIAALGAALSFPARAQPLAPPANPALACPIEGLPAEQRDAAIAEASRDLLGTEATAEEPRRAARDALAASARRCTTTRGWTERQGNVAFQYALLQLAREGMIRRYAAQHVDLSFIDSAVEGLTRGVEPPFQSFEARLRAQGLGDDRPDSAGDVAYIYMMLVFQLMEARGRFADPAFQLR